MQPSENEYLIKAAGLFFVGMCNLPLIHRLYSVKSSESNTIIGIIFSLLNMLMILFYSKRNIDVDVLELTALNFILTCVILGQVIYYRYFYKKKEVKVYPVYLKDGVIQEYKYETVGIPLGHYASENEKIIYDIKND